MVMEFWQRRQTNGDEVANVLVFQLCAPSLIPNSSFPPSGKNQPGIKFKIAYKFPQKNVAIHFFCNELKNKIDLP